MNSSTLSFKEKRQLLLKYLAVNLHHFKSIIDRTLDIVFVIDLEGQIITPNRAFEKLSGYSSEELAQLTLQKLLVSKHVDKFLHHFQLAIKGSLQNFDCSIIHSNQKRVDLNLTQFPVVVGSEILGVYVVAKDITEIKKCKKKLEEKEREQTQQLLLQSEKLTVAGQLAAGIAHEIRNPLTAIKGFLKLMVTNLTDDKTKTYFDIITSEMDRIEIILSELLTLAKPQDMKFVKSDIRQILESVKTLIDTQALMNNIEIITLYETNIFSIFCDVNQLKQVFINFLKNSIEAMPNGGKITVELRSHGLDKLKLLFIDKGSGIPDHILNRIYEPFFTTKEKGTGLGLMISKQIIENHNGAIHLWSDKNGTIVEVTLPIY